MPIFLHGLGLRNYRGIGDDEQILAPFKTLNIFIGANNAGKSAPLHFIHKYIERLGRETMGIEPLEIHTGAKEIAASVAICPEDFSAAAVNAVNRTDLPVPGGLNRLASELSRADGYVWLSTVLPSGSDWHFKEWQRGVIDDNNWRELWGWALRKGGGALDMWKREVHDRLLGAQRPKFPRAQLIPAIREIGPPEAAELDYRGKGLIHRLARLQNPNYNRLDDGRLFEKINHFLQDVVGNTSANIRVPDEKDHILVHINGKTLPLASLGTGIHEVVLIASFCSISQNEIVCMEEPELHLHPLLQKKLVRYLIDQTNNQYFIATHSPSFIDTSGAALFHVRNENGRTKISECVLRKEIYAVCDDLGHKASELAQSNAVVWVEGPSDRIYLKQWLKQIDQSLIEGIHFSIMFYGGRLLSHLSIDPEELQDFIDLRALNRNVTILIDSDKENQDDPINDTKKRIVAEFAKDGGVAWVTEGREIENYMAPALLQKSVKVIYPALYGEALPEDKYAHALHFKPSAEAAGKRKDKDAIVTAVDKIAVAKEAVKQPLDLDVYDLRERLGEVVGMIQKANGL